MFEQRDEAGLLKMTVTRQRLGDPLVAHDHERNAIRQRPIFVGTGGVEGDCFLQQGARRGDDLDRGAGLDVPMEVHEPFAITNLAQAIRQLRDDPVRGDTE